VEDKGCKNKVGAQNALIRYIMEAPRSSKTILVVKVSLKKHIYIYFKSAHVLTICRHHQADHKKENRLTVMFGIEVSMLYFRIVKNIDI
jgi:hypothetical protein